VNRPGRHVRRRRWLCVEYSTRIILLLTLLLSSSSSLVAVEQQVNTSAHYSYFVFLSATRSVLIIMVVFLGAPVSVIAVVVTLVVHVRRTMGKQLDFCVSFPSRTVHGKTLLLLTCRRHGTPWWKNRPVAESGAKSERVTRLGFLPSPPLVAI